MSSRTWFIGSRRNYGASHGQPVQRLDPGDFWRASLDDVQRREYELEVLERVIADIRDAQADTTLKSK